MGCALIGSDGGNRSTRHWGSVGAALAQGGGSMASPPEGRASDEQARGGCMIDRERASLVADGARRWHWNKYYHNAIGTVHELQAWRLDLVTGRCRVRHAQGSFV